MDFTKDDLELLAAGLLGGKQNLGQNLSQGLLLMRQGRTEREDRAQRNQQQAMQQQMLQFQLNQARRQEEEQQRAAEAYRGLPNFADPRSSMPSLAPTQENAAMLAQQKPASPYEAALREAQYFQEKGLPQYAEKAFARADKLKPKYSQTPQYDQQGNAFVMDDLGGIKYLQGVKARDKIVADNLGGTTVYRTEYSANPIGAANRTMTPGERDASARGWAGLSLDREKFGFSKEQAATKADKPLTDAQAKAYLFGNRMQASHKIIDDLAAKGVNTPSYAKQVADAVPGIGPILGAGANTMFASPEEQQVEQAQRDFINAVLRRESGAVISPEEFSNGRRQYFPQPGDTKEVIEQKRRNREMAIQGVMMEVPKGTPSPNASGFSIRRLP